MKLLRRYPEIIALFSLALLTRFWSLFTPNAVVFDEVYFKAFAGNYLTGQYFFDIHPPLGKLILAGWATLMHLNPATLISPTEPSVMMRIVPAFAGALLIPLFYIFLRQLGGSRRIATLGAGLLLLDNALLVESRFILTDSLLILFGLGAATAFLAARKHTGRARLLLITLAALLAGTCLSTKWTGLAALGLIGLVWLADHIRRWKHFSWRSRFAEALILIVLPLGVYMSVFAVHFALLTKSGPGDAFMTPRFQATLSGNANYNPQARLGFLEKFAELNLAMMQSEESLKTATHPYSSKWNTWPLMARSVYYWQGDAQPDGRQGNIYLLGNPVVWWGILLVLLGGVLASSHGLSRLRKYRFALGFLGLGYVLNFLPFIGIGRVMFLYHYLFALIYSLAFAVIMLGVLEDWTKDSPAWKFSTPRSRNIYISIFALALAGFAYFAPLTYGIPLTPAGLEQHMWLPGWR
jgi:dolichyl-phosphate-mannose-protein mannosyltransferase